MNTGAGSLSHWRRQWQPIPVLFPGKSPGWRSLVGCSPWGRYESGRTEQLHFHFSLSCIGEGNGNLLQCSCLENPRDRGDWWAAVYGVAQSRTRLKRFSSSSSNSNSLSHLQGIFPTQESNWGILHCRWIFFFFFNSWATREAPLPLKETYGVIIYAGEINNKTFTLKLNFKIK